MFGSMINSLFKKSTHKTSAEKPVKPQQSVEVVTRQHVDNMLSELDEMGGMARAASKESITETFELLSVADSPLEDSIANSLDSGLDETKSVVNSDEENPHEPVEDGIKNKDNTLDRINSLQCLFTWNLKSIKRNITEQILNTYGEYNLDISSPEFSLKRFVGNLIIGYELFHNGEVETAQMKVLEVGKWLEELDNGSDKFYLSINTGLYHVMKGTFIHMLYATNLIGECKWLLDDLVPYDKIDSKSKASIYAVHAAVLTEYGRNASSYKKACYLANKACILDPYTPHWFYIYAIVLSAQRKFLLTYKSSPTENEINAIQHAIMLSDGKNTVFNYHRMLLDRDTVIRNYHNNINIKNTDVIENNLKANMTIVQMIKTILSMEPKDPILVVGCARVLMTLPIKVRDFDLGKKYLTKAIEMAPNDVAVISSVEKTIAHYKQISNKTNEPKKPASRQYQPSFKGKQSNITEELSCLVYRHKNGKDALPNLIALLDKFNGRDKLKIKAQICSYSIFFANNLRAGVEQFIELLEEPGVTNDLLIKQHYSSFGSKKFNLAELVCNELRLATNSCETSSGEMLFYFKTLTKIMETFNLEMKDVDPSMKSKLIVDSSARSTCSNTAYQSDSNSSDNDSEVDQSENKTNKSSKPARFQNNGAKSFNQKPRLTKKKRLRTSSTKKDNFQTNFQSQSHQSNPYDIDQMKSRMSKFMKSAEKTELSNHAPLKIKNLGELRTHEEIGRYTQMLYQHISNDKPQHNISPVDLNTFPNQSGENSNHFFQPPQLQYANPPSLLNIRPQINPLFLQSIKRDNVNKKKSRYVNKRVQ